MKVKVELSSHFLDDEHQVFVLHPGTRKRFYNVFPEYNQVFLDLPGAEFTYPLEEETDAFASLIAISKKVKRWHETGRDPLSNPSRTVADHQINKSKVSKTRLFSEALGLYKNAKKGDLVVCPGPGYMKPVLIGEFSDDGTTQCFASHDRYPNEKIPARNVTWLSQDRVKAFFSPRLIALMQNRQALIKISSMDEKREIYDVAYGEYNIGDDSVGKILINKETIDFREFTKGADPVFYFSSLYNAIENDALEEFVSLEFQDAIDRFYDSEQFADIAININSPGYISLKARKASMASFISVMLGLSAYGVKPAEAAEAEFENTSSSVTSQCQLEIEAKVKKSMASMHTIRWEEICEKRQAATDSLGMDNTVAVRMGPQK